MTGRARGRRRHAAGPGRRRRGAPAAPGRPGAGAGRAQRLDRPGGAGLAALLAARDGGRGRAGHRARPTTPAGAGWPRCSPRPGVGCTRCRCAGATPEKIRLRRRRTGRCCGWTGAARPPAPAAGACGARWPRSPGARAILVSDYGARGGRHPALRAAIGRAGAPVVWDPHPRGRRRCPAPGSSPPTRPRCAHAHRRRPGDGPTGSPPPRAARAELRRRWRAGGGGGDVGAAAALLATPGRPRWSYRRRPRPTATRAAPATGSPPPPPRRSPTARWCPRRSSAAVAEATAYVAGGGAAPGHARPAGPDPRAAARRPRPGRGQAAGEVVARVRAAGGTVVATGGCFDLLHAGHVATLEPPGDSVTAWWCASTPTPSVRRAQGTGAPGHPAGRPGAVGRRAGLRRRRRHLRRADAARGAVVAAPRRVGQGR